MRRPRAGVPTVLLVVVSACTGAKAPNADTGIEPTWTADVGAATTAPTIAGGNVFIATEDGRVSVFSEDCANAGASCSPMSVAQTGPQSLTLDTDFTQTTDQYRSPVLSGDTVYVTTEPPNSQVVAISSTCAQGDGGCPERWHGDLRGKVSQPVVSDGTVFIAGYDRIYAFSQTCSGTCEPLWVAAAKGEGTAADVRAAGLGLPVAPTPLVDGDEVFASFGDLIYAFDAATGAALWVGGPGGGGCCGTYLPVVANGTVYATLYDRRGVSLFAFPERCAATRGECAPLWIGKTDDDFLSSPGIAGETVIVGTETSGGSGDGTLLAYPLDCGIDGAVCEPAWQAHVNVELSVGWFVGQGNAIFAVSREQAKMFAFAADCSGTCPPVWRTPALSGSGSDVVASTKAGPFRPVLANGLVIVATSGGTLWAFDPAACPRSGDVCQPQWTWQTAGALTDPVIPDNMLFVGSEQGTLYAFAI